MADDLRLPPERDFKFYQRKKHDKWREVAFPDPALEYPVSDSHMHLHMLPDPAHELARCAANGVDLVFMLVDVAEDNPAIFTDLQTWETEACDILENKLDGYELPPSCLSSPQVPSVRIVTGVHPHNAKLFSPAVKATLEERFNDERVVAIGEIGLDYYYDISPRGVQLEVFRSQLELARTTDRPVALHLRDGQNPDDKLDDAHIQALNLIKECDMDPQKTLLHCCTLGPDKLKPWLDWGCYIAFGGALTFKKLDEVREAAALVPHDRLLLETDAPFMTPEPMRGTSCTPAHVIYVAAALAEACGVSLGEARKAFLQQIHDNTLAFYRCDA